MVVGTVTVVIMAILLFVVKIVTAVKMIEGTYNENNNDGLNMHI